MLQNWHGVKSTTQLHDLHTESNYDTHIYTHRRILTSTDKSLSTKSRNGKANPLEILTNFTTYTVLIVNLNVSYHFRIRHHVWNLGSVWFSWLLQVYFVRHVHLRSWTRLFPHGNSTTFQGLLPGIPTSCSGWWSLWNAANEGQAATTFVSSLQWRDLQS